MDEKRIETKQEMEVDFKRVFGAVWSRAWLVVVVAITVEWCMGMV